MAGTWLTRVAAGAQSLVLLDEIASGTDPAQGAALAQAVLERMLEAGPRMVITTHYAQLKALATVDKRFAIAAMQYVDGAPTYKVHAATCCMRIMVIITIITMSQCQMLCALRSCQRQHRFRRIAAGAD
jgi:Fe-S cluster assembly ATPase SufC